jgi:hypothetical protein
MPARRCTWSATEAGAGTGAGRCLLFLDFDGVVCDSERECFVSSWLTYRELSSGDDEPGPHRGPERITLRARRRFRELRPLIRSGEDYVVIQSILAREEEQPEYRGPATQEAFDAYRQALGAPRIAAYKRAMAATRGSFLNRDRDGWLALNRIYPHMHELLTRCDLTNVRILSTKAAPLVCEILRAHAIPLADAAVFHAASNPDGADIRKLDMIAAQLDAVAGGRALFVEDQLDHLLGNHDRRIAAYLADWGYVLPQWLAQADHLRRNGVEILGGTQMAELFCRVAPVPG